MSIDVSVVVPVMNEEENIIPLVRETVEALKGESFEVLVVDDLSTTGPGIVGQGQSRIPDAPMPEA